MIKGYRFGLAFHILGRTIYGRKVVIPKQGGRPWLPEGGDLIRKFFAAKAASGLHPAQVGERTLYIPLCYLGFDGCTPHKWGSELRGREGLPGVLNDSHGDAGDLTSFPEFFKRATGFCRFPFQQCLAETDSFPQLINIPTGAGKTEGVVLAWLWRRHLYEERAGPYVPRRLVYCLPMRVLVEQTRDRVRRLLANLSARDVRVHILMAGEETEDWTAYPERPTILIGTQDMLLSRALNRGYGMSRFQWPRAAGLLNNDALWVFDEVQLMGPSLPTSAQLAAFRARLGTYGPVPSVWMSATLDVQWLRTIDFTPQSEVFQLTDADVQRCDALSKRVRAPKRLHRGTTALTSIPEETYARAVATEVRKFHERGNLSVVVLNTVRRATLVFHALEREFRDCGPDLRLLHSRYRPFERRRWAEFLDRKAPLPAEGRILVTTQVIEAGVDLDAKTLLTELAPWASIVQRFGRCNRFGDYPQSDIVWLDIDSHDSEPYTSAELDQARERLDALEGQDVSPESLKRYGSGTLPPPAHIVRLKDVIETFDTTADLSGNDVDVSRFIRDAEDLDVFVAWWEFDKQPPDEMPRRDELCPVPVSEFRRFLELHKTPPAWVWDSIEGEWRRLGLPVLRPGLIIVLPCSVGGYSERTGWSARATGIVGAVTTEPREGPDATGRDRGSEQRYWQTLRGHSLRTAEVASKLLQSLRKRHRSGQRQLRTAEVASELLQPLGLSEDVQKAVVLAARLHDLGKAHHVFQETLLKETNIEERASLEGTLWAKSPKKMGTHSRKFFRHELASALAVLMLPHPDLAENRIRNLVAYLVASHHGKIRLSIRSLPGEERPGGGRRYARGVWDGDEIPKVDLGDGLVVPQTVLSLSAMELGSADDGAPSWVDRVLSLRDALGPMRLEYLEALVRAADVRASQDPGELEVRGRWR